MAQAEDGTLIIVLNGKERTLACNLRATQILSRNHGGLSNLTLQIQAQNFDACVSTIRWGLNLTDKQAGKLPDEVYENGLTGELLAQLMMYVAMLGNGGKPPEGANVSDSGSGEGETEGNE